MVPSPATQLRVYAANRVLENNPRDHACFHLSALPPVGFRVIEKVINSNSSRTSSAIWRRCPNGARCFPVFSGGKRSPFRPAYVASMLTLVAAAILLFATRI